MAKNTTVLAIALLLCLTLHVTDAKYSPYGRAVRLDDVRALTLHRGKTTTARRVSSIPQLKCVGGCEYEPEVVQCTNVGSDGRNVQWRCEADMPANLKFRHTEVICEGFDSPEDDRVLEGSCGLEYSLTRTNGRGQTGRNTPKGTSEWSLGKWVMIALILYVGYNLYRQYAAGAYRPGPMNRSGSSSTPYTAPPTPSQYDSPPPPGYPATGYPANGAGFFNSGSWCNRQQPSWGGSLNSQAGGMGSWASAATGFGLGYLMGRPRGGMPQRSQQQSFWRSSQPWTRAGEGVSSGDHWGGSSFGSDSGGSSSGTHSSVGYASTSRR